ncbi:hypothetical protein [Bacillus safensis FO-36b] [Bacillus safensis subsp. safensis]
MLQSNLTEEHTALILSTPFLEDSQIEEMQELLYQQQDWNVILWNAACSFGQLVLHGKILNVTPFILRKDFKATYFLKSLEIMYKGQLETARAISR